MKKFLSLTLLLPLAVFSQNTVTPNSAVEGTIYRCLFQAVHKIFYSIVGRILKRASRILTIPILT